MAKKTSPNLAFEVHDDISLIVLTHGACAPTKQEWDRYLRAWAPVVHRIEQLRVLVLTDGGRPLREQQIEINKLLGGRSVRTAVVSSSMAVRFVIAMFALLNPGIRGFASSQVADALDHLGLTANERLRAQLIARRLSLATTPTREGRASLAAKAAVSRPGT